MKSVSAQSSLECGFFGQGLRQGSLPEKSHPWTNASLRNSSRTFREDWSTRVFFETQMDQWPSNLSQSSALNPYRSIECSSLMLTLVERSQESPRDDAMYRDLERQRTFCLSARLGVSLTSISAKNQNIRSFPRSEHFTSTSPILGSSCQCFSRPEAAMGGRFEVCDSKSRAHGYSEVLGCSVICVFRTHHIVADPDNFDLGNLGPSLQR